MATADLVLPRKAVEEAARAVYDGISMRVLTDYLPNSDQLATRVDVLYAFCILGRNGSQLSPERFKKLGEGFILLFFLFLDVSCSFCFHLVLEGTATSVFIS